MDDPDGGTATAWPLNGFTYAVGDVVYVSFASDAADSGIVVGSKAPVPLVALASIPDALLRDGSRTLTADWDIGDARRVLADGVRARDGAGLRLEDDAGNLGVFVEDGGQVGIGTAAPSRKLHVSGQTSDVTLRVDTTGADPNLLLTTLGQRDWSIGIDNSDSGKLKFDRATTVGSATAMTIDANNNVGIGRTILGAKLDVAGDVRLGTAVAPAVLEYGDTGDVTNNEDKLIVRGPAYGGVVCGALLIGRSSSFQNGRVRISYAQAGVDTEAVRLESGRVGLNVASPQGALHAHDGTGGMLFVTKTNIGAVVVTIIPGGTGDVVRGIAGNLVATDGVGVVANAFNILNPATLDVAVGSLTLRLEVTAAGALIARRQAGSGVATLALLGTWV
jgi:hypothetical protein